MVFTRSTATLGLSISIEIDLGIFESNVCDFIL